MLDKKMQANIRFVINNPESGPDSWVRSMMSKIPEILEEHGRNDVEAEIWIAIAELADRRAGEIQYAASHSVRN